MAGGSLVIGVLPTYNQVGWLAPILLLVARIAPGHVAGRRGVERVGLPRRDRAAGATRPLLVVLLHLDRLRGAASPRCSARCWPATLSDEPARGLGLADPVPDRRRCSGWSGCGCARGMAETDQFEENKAKAQAIKNPLLTHAARAPEGRRAAHRLHAALHAVLLHVLLGADARSRSSTQGLDDGMVFLALSIATALFVVLQYPLGWTADRFGRKPQMLVWSAAIAAADRAAVEADRSRRQLGSLLLVVLRRARPLHDDDLDRAGDHERAVPDRAARPRHRRLVQPDRRGVRRHRPAGHPVRCGDAGHSGWFFWYVAVGAAIAFVSILTLPETKGSVLR